MKDEQQQDLQDELKYIPFHRTTLHHPDALEPIVKFTSSTRKEATESQGLGRNQHKLCAQDTGLHPTVDILMFFSVYDFTNCATHVAKKLDDVLKLQTIRQPLAFFFSEYEV